MNKASVIAALDNIDGAIVGIMKEMMSAGWVEAEIRCWEDLAYRNLELAEQSVKLALKQLEKSNE